jgi:uncharacterized protein with GYD domain
MSTYIMLVNFTNEGMKTVKETGNRIEGANKTIASMGGKVIGVYGTMGQYDVVRIVEMPDDDSMAALLLRLGSGGLMRTTTLKAWPINDFVKIIGKIP